MTPEEAQIVACPECGGCGWVVGVEAVCCGHYLRSGECCSQPVAGQVQECCPSCCGEGFIDAPETGALLEKQDG